MESIDYITLSHNWFIRNGYELFSDIQINNQFFVYVAESSNIEDGLVYKRKDK